MSKTTKEDLGPWPIESAEGCAELVGSVVQVTVAGKNRSMEVHIGTLIGATDSHYNDQIMVTRLFLNTANITLDWNVTRVEDATIRRIITDTNRPAPVSNLARGGFPLHRKTNTTEN